MIYHPTLEKRQLEPITIPRCQIVFPIPRAWFEALRTFRVNPEGAISGLVCSGVSSCKFIETMTLREDFQSTWSALLANEIPPKCSQSETVNLSFEIREDVWEALESAAREVEKSAHEVALEFSPDV